MFVSNLSSLARQCASLFGVPQKKKKGAKKKDHALETRISQSLDEVLKRLAADGHRNVLVVGDRSFRDTVSATAALETSWASIDIADVLAGALNPDSVDFAKFDAVVCGGKDVATAFRLSVARMYAADAARPVHWVANDWEYCGGTLAFPAEADDVEALLFNHFRHYFGIKDALQFRVELFCGQEKKHFYRILGADESLAIRISDHFPTRKEAAAIAVFVNHPVLTRGRHVRLRLCGDIFWHNSLTTLHGLHEFNRPPSHKFSFRLSANELRNADVVLTVPNFARDLGENRKVVTLAGGARQEQQRETAKYVEQSRISGTAMGDAPHIGWEYAGYGGSNWYAMAPRRGSNTAGIISANHHASVALENTPDMAMDEQERQGIAAMRAAGYLLEPYALPVTRARDDLRFGFNTDSGNPPFSDFIIHCYDAQGSHLGEHRFHKVRPGRVFSDELPGVAEDPRVTMVTVTPDFERMGYRRKGLKLQFELIVEHRQTGDWDVTEGQSCFRNVGLAVPGVAHFAGPMGAVIGRTNLFARARSGNGFRTAVVANHGSGRADYKSAGHLTLTAFSRAGKPYSADVAIPSFTWRYLWLDELLPQLAEAAAPGTTLPLLATSMDADINCQIVTTTDNGAVSLQHMWGY